MTALNTTGQLLVQVDRDELERLQEVARAAQAVCKRGWIKETERWLRGAVGELNEEE